MLPPLHYMLICPFCYLDWPPVGQAIELVLVGLMVTVTVVVVAALVVDSAVEMEWMAGMQNFVAEMA